MPGQGRWQLNSKDTSTPQRRHCVPLTSNWLGAECLCCARASGMLRRYNGCAISSPWGDMNEVTRILNAIDDGDSNAAEQLLPLVYAELRKLAAQKLAREKPGQTLQATALVHEAYVRLVGSSDAQWQSRGHFFSAAAEAMRRILVERARRKKSLKLGGDMRFQEVDADDLSIASPLDPLEVLAIHDALERLATKSPRKAELVKLRCFLGCSLA